MRLSKPLDTLCRELVKALQEAAEAGADTARVVAIFEAKPHNTDHRRALLADAFQALDQRPSHFGSTRFCQPWHSLLRATRNDTAQGPALFALWS